MRVFVSIIYILSLINCHSLSQKNVVDDTEESLNIISNEESAIRIAESILISVYGDDIIKFRPFKAEMRKGDSMWFVYGTTPKPIIGGAPGIFINKSDCKVLRLVYGK